LRGLGIAFISIKAISFAINKLAEVFYFAFGFTDTTFCKARFQKFSLKEA